MAPSKKRAGKAAPGGRTRNQARTFYLPRALQDRLYQEAGRGYGRSMSRLVRSVLEERYAGTRSTKPQKGKGARRARGARGEGVAEVQTFFYLSDDLYAQLQAEAEAEGVSGAEQLRRILTEAMERPS